MAYYNYPNYMTPNWYGQQFYQPIQQPMQSPMQMSNQMQPPLTQAPQTVQQMPTQQLSRCKEASRLDNSTRSR